MQDFLSTSQAAKILGVSRVTVFNKIRAGKIDAMKIGRNFVIKRESIDRIIGKKGMLSDEKKQQIDEGVDRVIKEYEETLKLLQKS